MKISGLDRIIVTPLTMINPIRSETSIRKEYSLLRRKLKYEEEINTKRLKIVHLQEKMFILIQGIKYEFLSFVKNKIFAHIDKDN